ncbi:MAG: hypothetical protein M0Q92_12185 [Methanoregula sp.]|jgi:hypothetical protein|nr:hypothetical protein [Methanoregula sp.]
MRKHLHPTECLPVAAFGQDGDSGRVPPHTDRNAMVVELEVPFTIKNAV